MLSVVVLLETLISDVPLTIHSGIILLLDFTATFFIGLDDLCFLYNEIRVCYTIHTLKRPSIVSVTQYQAFIVILHRSFIHL